MLKDGETLVEGRSAKNLCFEIVEDAERLFSLKSDWDRLCSRSTDYNFSQSYQWCSVAWECPTQSSRRQLFCLVGWVDNTMVLIWPFVILRRGLWRMLRPLGSETTEYSDVLVEDGPEADQWALLAWRKLCETCNSDVIIFPFVRENSRLYRILSQERPMSAWGVSTSSINWDRYQNWESYYRSLKGEFRYSLRTKRRRLAQRGNLSFVQVTQCEEATAIIDWLLSQKTDWLIRTKQSGPWQDVKSYRDFLTRVVAERDGFGNLTLFVLKLDGQIISAILGRISRFSMEPMIAAYDRAYSQYGPGQLLYEDVIQWAFARRLEFDFRLGNYTYKRRWTNRESKVVTYRFVNSMWGAAFSLASRCRSKIKISFSLKNMTVCPYSGSKTTPVRRFDGAGGVFDIGRLSDDPSPFLYAFATASATVAVPRIERHFLPNRKWDR
jgi:CelD/BcsL family acetyltransferase involved in cellulose biosynthesis